MAPHLGAFACASEAGPASCMLRHPAGGGSTGRNCRSAACVLGARSRLGVWFPPGTPHRLALGHPRILDSRAVPHPPPPITERTGRLPRTGEATTAAPASSCFTLPPRPGSAADTARNPPMTRPRHKRPSALGALARAGGPAVGAVAAIVTACALVMATLGMTGATAAGGARQADRDRQGHPHGQGQGHPHGHRHGNGHRHGDGHRNPDGDVAAPDRDRHRPAVRHRDAHEVDGDSDADADADPPRRPD